MKKITEVLTCITLGIIALYFSTRFIMIVSSEKSQNVSEAVNYNYEIYRSRTDLSLEGIKDDIVTEIDRYIDSVAKDSGLNGIKLFELCDQYEVDVRFAMAQAEIESHFGTKGIAAKNKHSMECKDI